MFNNNMFGIDTSLSPKGESTLTLGVKKEIIKPAPQNDLTHDSKPDNNHEIARISVQRESITVSDPKPDIRHVDYAIKSNQGKTDEGLTY